MKMRKLISVMAAACLMGLAFAALPTAYAEGDINVVEGDTFTLQTSSTIKDATDDNKMAKHLLDGSADTYWCSAWINETTEPCEEWLLFDFRETRKITSITLTTRSDGYMFPSEFAFSWSVTNEVNIPIEGASFTNYAADPAENVFEFSAPVVARYIRLDITKRTADESGIHLVCFAEAAASVEDASAEEQEEAARKDAAVERPKVVNDPKLGFSIACSSYLEQEDWWIPENLTDGQLSTQWSSEWVGVTSEDDEIYVTASFGEEKKVTGVILSTQKICFPRDFCFQYTLDNNNWVDIPGAAYTDFRLTESLYYTFPFETPQVATAIRLKVTKKTADPSGNYLCQLADVDVRGFDPTDEEIKQATDKFNIEIGNMPVDPNVKPTPIPATPEDFVSASGCGGTVGAGLGGMFLLALAAALKRRNK